MEAVSTAKVVEQVAKEDCLLVFKTLLLNIQAYECLFYLSLHPTACYCGMYLEHNDV